MAIALLFPFICPASRCVRSKVGGFSLGRGGAQFAPAGHLQPRGAKKVDGSPLEPKSLLSETGEVLGWFERDLA